MPMNFKYLCQQYNLGRFLGAAELDPGTESRVWKLDTEGGAFLVRTLRDREQGQQEWDVYRALRSGGFAAMPAILVPCAEQGGVCYQVQEHLTGTMPDPAEPGVAATMARTAKELAAAMPAGMIHGDLGPWNMLLHDNGQLAVIDFGELRQGDPCFDFASLFGGVINHTPADLRRQVCGEFLHELACDRERLLEQLRLWAEQGIEEWQDRSEKMVSRFINARTWAEENLHEL